MAFDQTEGLEAKVGNILVFSKSIFWLLGDKLKEICWNEKI